MYETFSIVTFRITLIVAYTKIDTRFSSYTYVTCSLLSQAMIATILIPSCHLRLFTHAANR